MDGIILQQVGVDFHRAEVVYADDFHIVALRFNYRPKDQPADPAKSVDSNSYRHY
jgi:hypothetical protein